MGAVPSHNRKAQLLLNVAHGKQLSAENHSSTKQLSNKEIASLAETLSLAGQPLPPPRFHTTGWREGQTFSARQDPDRTREKFNPPSFLISRAPAEQIRKTSVQELPVSSGGRSESFARVVRGVLDEEHCVQLLECVNHKGFTPALLNIGGGRQMMDSLVRDGHRVIVDSPELSTWLLEVLRPYMPAVLQGAPEGHGDPRIPAQLVDLNERCRFLCYTPGQHFAPHYDACYERPQNHPHCGDMSMVTVQVYLHDVPEKNGGATTFLPERYSPQRGLPCQPGAGCALIFTQDLYHEGSMVMDGLKYTLRTEAMYRQAFSH